MPSVNYNDLEVAMQMASSSGHGIEFLGYISRQTGQVYCATENNEFGEDEDELPADVDDPVEWTEMEGFVVEEDADG